MDISKQIQTPEYDFLRNHPRLGNRIILLGPGGSYAYGTYQENSDLDIRGITLNLPSDLLGLTQFEQYEDAHTDTVIYSFNKIIRLLLACNPNTIEILGLDDDQYLIRTPIGQELLDMRARSSPSPKCSGQKYIAAKRTGTAYLPLRKTCIGRF